MKHYTQQIVNVVSNVQCDVCGRVDSDQMEIQEYLHVNFRAGYSSVFGDLNRVECDVCQHCVQRLLGPFIRITDEMPWTEVVNALKRDEDERG